MKNWETNTKKSCDVYFRTKYWASVTVERKYKIRSFVSLWKENNPTFVVLRKNWKLLIRWLCLTIYDSTQKKKFAGSCNICPQKSYSSLLFLLKQIIIKGSTDKTEKSRWIKLNFISFWFLLNISTSSECSWIYTATSGEDNLINSL